VYTLRSRFGLIDIGLLNEFARYIAESMTDIPYIPLLPNHIAYLTGTKILSFEWTAVYT